MNDAQKLQFASEKSSIHFFYSPLMSVIGPSNIMVPCLRQYVGNTFNTSTFFTGKVGNRSGDRRPEAERHQLKQSGTILLLSLKAVNWLSQHISKAKPLKKEGLFNINKAILFGMLMPLYIPI